MCDLFTDGNDFEADTQFTFVVAGALQPLTYADIYFASHAAERGDPDLVMMPQDALQAWLAAKPNTLLTDDYVPVDNLLIPVYLDSR